MSEQEAFETWLQDDVVISSADDKTTAAEWAWQACAERKDKIIEQQALELAALRGFAARVLSPYVHGELFRPEAKRFGLIDETGHPTPLLTGESE